MCNFNDTCISRLSGNQCVLTLVRSHHSRVCTRGDLYFGDERLSTLEPSDYIIPEGTYLIRLSHSPRFSSMTPYKNHLGSKVPEIIGVYGHTGIRIHVGNHPSDTEGCILVGTSGSDSMVINSVLAYGVLCSFITKTLANNPNAFFTLRVLNNYE